MKLTLETLHMHADEVGKCLIWRGTVGNHGYPQARLGGRTQLVRAYVYRELMGVELLAGRRITSRCGNPLCISPACISQATAGQLMARSYSSGARRGPDQYIARLRRAQRSGQAKLTSSQVAEIRALPSEHSHMSIAREYGVHGKTISAIRRGLTWRTGFAGSSVFAFAGAMA